MKKTLLLFAALFFSALGIQAQAMPSSAKDDNSHPCRIVIKGSYETTCPYIVDKIDYDEYPNTLVACKGSRVTYTAYAYLGTATAASYTWSVIGDVSHTVSTNEVVVDWGTNDWGWLSVMVVSSAGDTCYEEARVSLIDKPTVASTTIPSYTLTSAGTKVVYVCMGSDVTFMDQSEPGNSDIAGCLWSAMSGVSSETPNFTLSNVTSNTVVTHRVTNSCGCYDEEIYKVEIIQGRPFELDCYGTVCEGATVTYKIVSPNPCNEYVWHVDGGTLVNGQYTPSPTVVWDHPQDGYGTIGIDGWRCRPDACPQVMKVKIPVIQNNLAISGQQEVCIDEAVQFSLPLFGSTAYQWSISPTAGIEMDNTLANTLTIRFSQPGNYTLRCTYRCDFLGCGPYHAEPLTIVVKPRLEIEGWDQVCLGSACALQTAPNVSATWRAYDLGSGGSTPVATATGTSFTHTFATSGRYLVTAEHSSYCSPATFTLTVKDPPPAPTADDLDPANRHTACLYGGIALSGSPSEPNYTLVWMPDCSTASPALHSGDSVAIGYQAEVCDVHVYNYDRRLQCLSTDYYVHTVSPLVPDSVLIPSTITVCPGTSITWGTDVVPDQRSEGMLYEWTIEETKQYCASVQGSHLQPGVTLVVNNIPTPTTFYVRLRRSFCGGYVDKLIHFNVVGTPSGPLSISGPDTVCVGVSAHFTGAGGHSDTYRWYAESTVANSVDFDHAFESSGTKTVRLTSREHDYCTNPDYLLSTQHTVHVFELPMVQGLQYNSYTHVVSVVPTLPTSAYTFDWYIEPDGPGPASSFTGGNTTNANTTGTYQCTVTDRATGCSRTVSLHVAMQPSLCDTISVTKDAFDYCNSSIQLHVNNTDINGNVNWSVRGGAYAIETSGTNSRDATITVGDIGIYTVNIQFTYLGDCYNKTLYFTVNYLPSFTFEPACDRIIIHNNSRYADPAQTIQLRVYNSCSILLQTLSFPASQRTYTYIPTPTPTGECTYSFSLYKYGNTLVDQPCTQGQVSIGVPSLAVGANPVSITLENPYSSTNTCDNTPVELVASLNYSPANLVSSSWSFGDNSQYDTTGDRIHHTFANSSGGFYFVNINVVDHHGCHRSSSTPLQISSSNNPLISGTLSQDGTNQCPYVGTITLTYIPDNSINHYTWESNSPTPVNTYATHHNDNYHLLVVNDNYCHRELAADVFFLNAPSAFIFAENYTCCQGEEIILYGDAGPSENNGLTYLWTITNSFGTTVQTGTTPTFHFSSTTPGTYNATLIVSNGICSATAHATLTVLTPPPAPTLAFGSSSCIGNAPVELLASGYTGTVHWSNGDTGPTAHYYAPGQATAYYFDPAIGCRSESSTRQIAAQPDFEALLTGCYERCKYLFPVSLPVYSFPNESVDWQWYQSGSLLSSGTTTGNSSPITLPLPAPASYRMEVDYGVGCHEASPTLDIRLESNCKCDSLYVTYDIIKQSHECPLTISYKVIVCNTSSDTACLNTLDVVPTPNANYQLISTTFSARTLAPGNCTSFEVVILVHSLEPDVACFRLYDSCHNCTKTFNLLLDPKVGCSRITNGGYNIITQLSSPSAIYLHFSLNSVPCPHALACWSEPAAVIDWTGTSTGVSGLAMIDMATLSQLALQGEEICFHVLCCSNDLCDWYYCINTAQLYNAAQYAGLVQNVEGETDKAAPPTETPTGGIRLVPNPTTGVVAIETSTPHSDEDVASADGSVEEVKVMDMQGRQIEHFTDTGHFDISHLTSGVYLVRIVTRDSEGTSHVHYLKLAKK